MNKIVARALACVGLHSQAKARATIALVTGASSGIGESLCHLLAEQRIHLIISGRNLDKLQALKTELQDRVDVTIVPADLSLIEDRSKLIQVIQEKKPDLVINNAGYGLYGDALSHPIEKQMEMLQVDVASCLELTLTAARVLVEAKKQGVILNVSSVAGCLDSFPGLAIYSASKAFLNSMSQALNEEMSKYGIHVLAACPGQVNTKFRERASLGATKSESNVMSPEYAAQQIWKQILKRKPLHVFSLKYSIGIFLMRFLLPKRWIYRLLYRNIETYRR
jgi:short-subunit dehydrogenase